jgi:hypothetical protein
LFLFAGTASALIGSVAAGTLELQPTETAPPNATAILALMVAALAVSGAIFLILDLDELFGGLIRISSEPMLNALHQLSR